jgi:DNA-binding NarL/FixJ family response regulator
MQSRCESEPASDFHHLMDGFATTWPPYSRRGGSMSNIRVLIRDAPTMLRDILEQAISSEPDMEVIPEPVVSPPTEEQLQSPDVVVVGMSDAQPAEGARALLDRWPHSHVLVITARGHRVLQYQLLPRGVDLGEMSPAQLAEAIRAAARPRRKPYAH